MLNVTPALHTSPVCTAFLDGAGHLFIAPNTPAGLNFTSQRIPSVIRVALAGNWCFALTEGNQVMISNQASADKRFLPLRYATPHGAIISTKDLIVQMVASPNSVYFLLESGQWLYTEWGKGWLTDYHWSAIETWKPEVVLQPGENITAIFSGENCAFLVSNQRLLVKAYTDTGVALLSGIISLTMLGYIRQSFVPANHTVLPLLEEGIKDITFGAEHILLLTNQGNLYGIGSNTNGQLGLQKETVTTFTKICDAVSQVVAGALNTVIAGLAGVFVLGPYGYVSDNKLFARVTYNSDDLLFANKNGSATSRILYCRLNQQINNIRVEEIQFSSRSGSPTPSSQSTISITSTGSALSLLPTCDDPFQL